MNASVVILTANRAKVLRACLDSVAAQTLLPGEIVVVDNGSTDETPAVLARWDSPIPLRVIRREASDGSFAEARNAGVMAASSEAIAMIDDDCEADPFWLERLLRGLEKWEAVGGTALPADDYGPPDTYSPEQAWAVGLTPPGFFGPLGGSVVLPPAANLAFRRATVNRHPFQQLGQGFAEEGVYLQGREDAEWWRRLRRAGVPCGVEPRALVWHRIPPARYQRAAIGERAEADGIAHWRREAPHVAVRFAAADVLRLPVHFVQRAAQPHLSASQAWSEATAWAGRQRAFLRTAVDDADRGVAPSVRTRAYLREGISVAANLGRGLLRTAAVPMCEAIRSKRGIELSPKEPPERLLAVLHPFLGDAVLALPLLRQIAAKYPDTRLVLAAGERNMHLLAEQLPEWKVRKVPASAAGYGIRQMLALRNWLVAQEPEAILLLYAHGLAALPFLLTEAPVIGWEHDNGLRQRVWGELLNVPVEKPWNSHESIALLNLAAPLGIVTKPERPSLLPGVASDTHVDALLGSMELADRPFAVLHVDAPMDPKYWRPAQAAEAAQLCVDRDLVPLLIGGKGGRGAAEEVKAFVPTSRVLNGRLDSAQLGALYRRAALAIGPDSGPQHVAAAAGCPSVVLFGPTDERRWGAFPLTGGSPVAMLRGVALDWTHEERTLAGEESMVSAISGASIADAVASVLAVRSQVIDR